MTDKTDGGSIWLPFLSRVEMARPEKTMLRNDRTRLQVAPSRFWWVILGLALPLILAIYGLAWSFLVTNWGDRLERFGQFGDAFGAVNALFSGLALFGVVVALFLQIHEMHGSKQDSERQAKFMMQAAKLNAYG